MTGWSSRFHIGTMASSDRSESRSAQGQVGTTRVSPSQAGKGIVKLLLIEDDAKIAAVVKRGLEAEGFTVEVAVDGNDGLWLATEGRYDLIILDIMLPGRNGFQICSDLRAASNWTPILMLTAKDGDLDEAEALDSGADDYLTKPFSFPVLIARVRSVLRRVGGRGEPVATDIGDLRVDPLTRRVCRGTTEIALTARQFDVLEYLVRRVGQVVSKQELLDGVWQYDFDGDINIVEVYIRRLRAAIDEPFGRHAIETVRGAGYRLAASGG
jgi:two-component system, OmpR family, response regulator